MRANGNFGNVKASQNSGGGMLQPGGYACMIYDVQDGTADTHPYIGLVLNVLDAKTNTLKYTQDLAVPENRWRHTYRYFVSKFDTPGIDWERYKALVEAVENTRQNNGFKYQDVDGGEQQLKGKWIGCVFRHFLYVPKSGNNAGKEREGVELSYVCTAEDALNGNFDSYYTELRDGRPDYMRNAPAKVAPTPASAPTPAPETAIPVTSFTQETIPAPETAIPVIADEDIPF